MTDGQLANLRWLAEQATKWPTDSYYSISDAEWVYYNGKTGRIVCVVRDDGNAKQAGNDARYIAAACAAAPELLDDLAAMTDRAERAEARELELLAANAGVARVGVDWLDELITMTARAEAAERETMVYRVLLTGAVSVAYIGILDCLRDGSDMGTFATRYLSTLLNSALVSGAFDETDCTVADVWRVAAQLHVTPDLPQQETQP